MQSIEQIWLADWEIPSVQSLVTAPLDGKSYVVSGEVVSPETTYIAISGNISLSVSGGNKDLSFTHYRVYYVNDSSCPPKLSI